ncbi:D-tagatose-bisphosphate aldolase, class II, non-catalytic subunit [Curtobacterium sp. MCBD17_019]|uniref:D-tagatose-bisphosphate aldolase, class II, non-catalytic subunit n=1 Tax=Curtobacterium sp. MCBD17_019 TaxID=2175669 RepID=UPI000DA7B08E|nr:D-tagatose-bisphosphate aldolase, class II, non-catalytic subunit [Curtobacterium sp. MCBD17_019]PZE76626.1 D-tagatose-bisphosphate aldolase, class II, non-catalytic subunit [Curtobacterium sp. MCBD17_019]
MNQVEAIVRRHRGGDTVGITSVCSAHPLVLRASMRQALEDGSVLLIEATSNQVDQFGGYTGLTPEQFRDQVLGFADEESFPRDRLVLGGDHLGPNRWQRETPDQAMPKADDLVAAYAAAGYAKLHIDCSMRLDGDPTPLPDAVVAERAARLIAIAEAARPTDGEPPVYVIGTEVPVPGGAHETLGALQPTSPAAARETLDAHRGALRDRGLDAVWPRVVALVVQPGVEFDHLKVIDYDRTATQQLQRVLDDEPDMVFEAHSTDYQTRGHLTELVEDHWAVLKVGPGLTFALREALFALAAIEGELVPAGERSDLVTFMDERMVADPGYWEHYYEGDAEEQRIARRYSYSDRIRYYWASPEVEERVDRLFTNLTASGIPEPLIGQFLPKQFTRVRQGVLAPEPEALAVDAVREVLRDYAAACGHSVG